MNKTKPAQPRKNKKERDRTDPDPKLSTIVPPVADGGGSRPPLNQEEKPKSRAV